MICEMPTIELQELPASLEEIIAATLAHQQEEARRRGEPIPQTVRMSAVAAHMRHQYSNYDQVWRAWEQHRKVFRRAITQALIREMERKYGVAFNSKQQIPTA